MLHELENFRREVELNRFIVTLVTLIRSGVANWQYIFHFPFLTTPSFAYDRWKKEIRTCTQRYLKKATINNVILEVIKSVSLDKYIEGPCILQHLNKNIILMSLLQSNNSGRH